MAKRVVGIERKKRSIIRRLLSGFINGSNSYIVQYLPDVIFSAEIDLQRLRSAWIHGHKKNNDADLVRLLFLVSNIRQLLDEGIEGDIAELGVYRGNAARVLHELVPDRQLYLLDTFSGFSANDLTDNEPTASVTGDFHAGLDEVRAFVGDHPSIHYIPGYFPESAAQLPEDARFAFVNLDVDLYEPIKAGLEYFYPRLAKGGMMAIHDYANSCWPGVKKAVDEFLHDKPERLVVLPDRSGTASFRKH